MILSGKTAVIAGATGGLGKIVTEKLEEDGARLALLGRSEDRLFALLKKLKLPVEDHFVAAADLTDPESLGKTGEAVFEKFGQVDVLLNLVGGWVGGEQLVEVSPDPIENMLDQHLWSTYHLVRAFVPHMGENQFGRVIVVSSPTATRPGPKSGPYAIGKAAQEALMLTLAQELDGTGVTANVIEVRAIDTEHKRDSDSSGKYAGWTTPEEITETIRYLCTVEAARLNGARLPLYG
ncbi:MAG: SDR family oxidoreductase [Anaerolineales bacterium]|jgi:NAD(P)-dependent dehydrogenase (short-subunit alcohol dehydrogenase family)